MVTPPHGVRLRLLLAVAIVVGVVSWVGLALWAMGGRALPPVSWAALPILLAVAIGLVLAGRPVQRLVAGTATRRVHPLYAARVIALAQAAALTGAVGLGWYAAQVVRLLPDSDIPSQQQDILRLVFLGVGAVLVSGAGLLVQRWCRVDDDRGDRGSPERE
ncbi:DUF3180 domain-containing protein [Dermatophilaceae bacterium Soc4.6]